MVKILLIKIEFYFDFILEMHQDLSEYHLEKMKKVQRKLDNLRKITSG